MILDPQETPVQMDAVELEAKTEEMEDGDQMVQEDPPERKDELVHVDPQDHLDPQLEVRVKLDQQTR